MPLVPNLIEKTLFLTFNQAPGPSLDMWGGPAFRFVLAALRLGVFEALAGEPRTADQLAAKLHTDKRGTRILLETLTRLRYLKRRGDGDHGRYENTEMTRKWLLDDGAINFTPFYLYWGAIMEAFFPRLEESIRTGEPPVNLYEWLETQPEVSSYFQRGMVAIARYIEDDVARLIPLEPSARILDVGGGHGRYSAALCRRSPDARAVVFDSPGALVTAQETITEAGLSDRVTLCAGNFLRDDLPTGFDVALVFNIVHGLSPEGNVALFRQVRAALNPGGRIVILEQLSDASPLPLLEAVTHILSMSYYHVIGGQMYSYEDLRGWLEAAGYTGLKGRMIAKVGSALISARNGAA